MEFKTTHLIQPGLLLALLAAGMPWAMAASAAGPPPAPLQAGRVGWTRIDLEAHKVFMSARTTAEWAIEDGPAAASRLIALPTENGRGAVIPPGPAVLTLTVMAEIPGTRSATTLWMDPGTANSLQYEIVDSGRRHRKRLVRFAPDGAYQRTRRPRKSEDATKPDTWTDLSADFWPYGHEVAGAPVIDSLSLLYVAAASGLDRPGDRLEVLVYQRRELVRVTLKVDGEVNTPVAYRATGSDGARVCRGSARALRLRLSVLPLGPATPDFDFLGLKSDIAVLLEPELRVPLRIEGRAAVVGRVTSTVKEVRLKAGASCPRGISGSPD
ncbi:MAG: hypothetical protein JNK40_07900 [Chromatiales bacterium]|nr:hypothetical protein [Chromatiales bacterium]